MTPAMALISSSPMLYILIPLFFLAAPL